MSSGVSFYVYGIIASVLLIGQLVSFHLTSRGYISTYHQTYPILLSCCIAFYIVDMPWFINCSPIVGIQFVLFFIIINNTAMNILEVASFRTYFYRREFLN